MPQVQGIDFIGDVHGRYRQLKLLLERLGYRWQQGCYRHPYQTLVFVGDLIDQGPEQRRTLDLVHAMVERDQAKMVLGNHEYNALCFATPDPMRSGHYLREHNDKNIRQHQAFLDEYHHDPQGYRDAIAWLMKRPLYFEQDGARAIHACWHPSSLVLLDPLLSKGKHLNDAFLYASCHRGSVEWQAIENLLKGPEQMLPDGIQFLDKYSNPRRDIRIRWWMKGELTYRQVALVPEGQKLAIPQSFLTHPLVGYDGASPLFIGHYWLSGVAKPMTEQIACLDYSADGQLVCYRWQGEKKLNPTHYLSV